MTNIVQLSHPKTFEQQLSDILDRYTSVKTGALHIEITDKGRSNQVDPSETTLNISSSSQNFSILNDLREVYVKRLGLKKVKQILTEIRRSNLFSNHICEKVREFIEEGNPFFNIEAQFPPEVIRRPEKNQFFATTFTMIVTSLVVNCHLEAFKDNPDLAVFQIDNAQNLDRASLRLLQNLLLYLKPFHLNVRVIFQRTSSELDFESPAQGQFIQARRRCFGKFIQVAIASGCHPVSIDVDGLLKQVNFHSAFCDTKKEVIEYFNSEVSLIDSLRDLIYKSNYEQFFAFSSLTEELKKLSVEDLISYHKLGVLADSYNYQFDHALQRIEAQLDKVKPIDQCYFLIMKGLIQLKKHNDHVAAQETLKLACETAEQLEDPLNRVIERAYASNALNFVRVIGAAGNIEGSEKRKELFDILESEYGILSDAALAFSDATKDRLAIPGTKLTAIFIITTLVENICKLNTLLQLHSDNVTLLKSYDHIISTQADRIDRDNYKTSYVISFSHAKIQVEMSKASAHVAENSFEEAYNVTRNLLSSIEDYDVTGNYRGFVLNAHAMNAARIRRENESIECFTRMAEIYLGYNEPYMIKVALNGLAKLVPDRKLKGLDILRTAGLIDNDFKPHNEVRFLVNSAVDLENPLMGGLEQVIFSNRSASELHEYTKTEKSLNAAFKSYGHWRFISTLSNTV